MTAAQHPMADSGAAPWAFATGLKPLLAALLAGLVSALGFEPLALWPLTLAAFAFLIWLVGAAPHLRSALARGWWFGVGHFTIGLNWIATAFTYQAAMPAWLGWIAIFLLSLYLAVYPAAAAGLAWRWGRERRVSYVLLFAAAWIVTEWLRATMFTGFAWNPAGVVLLETPLSRLATLIGTYGLSGIFMLLAGSLLLLAERKWREAEKWKPEQVAANMARMIGLSRIPGPRAQLLLWPEAAVTRPLEIGVADPYDRQAAESLRRRIGAVAGPGALLLTGGVTLRAANGVDISSATNSVFALDGSGRVHARYDKAHLVPYGEYLPMRPILSRIGLSRLAPGDIDFDPGPGPRSFDLPIVGKVGFQLCYEIIFSGEVVDRRNRPGFIFNPSNDAWFGRWGPPQHLAQARLRALEEGLPVLRATPDGVSAVVDAEGSLVRSLPWRTAGIIDTNLPGPKPPTLFARFGNILPLLLALLLAASAIAVGRRRR